MSNLRRFVEVGGESEAALIRSVEAVAAIQDREADAKRIAALRRAPLSAYEHKVCDGLVRRGFSRADAERIVVDGRR